VKTAAMKRLTTKTRFGIGTAVILLIVCISVAAVVYLYLKRQATARIFRETEIFVATADATRTYVKDELRPKIESLLPQDSFIPHAMSTSFVGRNIMTRLRKRFPDFSYKRAALDPINPINNADPLERRMLDWFTEHAARKEWHGLVNRGNRSYYARFRAIYAEAECLRCHGEPDDAPAQMLEIYGRDGGFHYHPGQVVAADSIYIPVDVTFVKIKEVAWNVFLIAAIMLVAILGLFYLLFNRTVIGEMKALLARFRSIPESHHTAEKPQFAEDGDEFDQVKYAMEQVAEDLRDAHQRLKSSEAKYRLLFETSRDPILICDEHNRLRDINPAGCQLFGFTDIDEALSIETFYQLFWDTRQARAFREKVREKGFVDDLEAEMVNRHGDKMTVLVSATGRQNSPGHFTGIDIHLHDITHRRRLQQQMSRTEKLASIGQLASGVAHEINNPLGVIACYTNLVTKNKTLDEQARNDLSIIQKHTEQCKHVVEALLNFARIPSPSKEDCDISRCIQDVLTILEPQMKAENIRPSLDVKANRSTLAVDATQMLQVFMNVILNAIQAMAGGGRLNIQLTNDPDERGIRIHLSDTGHGIAEKYISRIYDPFFTTKAQGQGTGLGLAVSYGIVRQHGGDIDVVSSVGKGTTVSVWLPFHPPDLKPENSHGT
jgi:PAS domain S-box-containing protein